MGSGKRKPTPLRHDLRVSVIDAVGCSLMVGIGETYLPAFALASGMSQVSSGLASSVPMFAGALLQLGSPLAVQRLGSNRSWVVGTAAAQAACFLPMIAAAIFGAIPPWAVFLLIASYWASSMASGPAWNTWIATLVPPKIRPRYFSRRSRTAQVAVLSGLLIGGFTLHEMADAGHPPLLGFAIIFSIAAAARFVSVRALASQHEPVPPPSEHRTVGPRELLRRMRTGNDGKLLSYMVALQFAVQISGPYFAPFMLRQLHLSYAEYMFLIALSFSGKILGLTVLGGVAKRYGARRLLVLGALGIVPLSGSWLISNDFWYLCFIQVAGGVAWGAYELASFLMLFEAISDQERTSILTTFNVLNASAIVVGSMIGGAIIASLGAEKEAFYTVFALSSLLRFVFLSLLRRIEDVPIVISTPISTRTDAVDAATGSIEKPIIAAWSRSWLGVRELGERGRRAIVDLVRGPRD